MGTHLYQVAVIQVTFSFSSLCSLRSLRLIQKILSLNATWYYWRSLGKLFDLLTQVLINKKAQSLL
jgi:hypothetical protein